MKTLIAVLLLAVSSFASSGTFLGGLALGAGLVVTKKYTVVPAAKLTAKAAKKTAHVTKKAAQKTASVVRGQ